MVVRLLRRMLHIHSPSLAVLGRDPVVSRRGVGRCAVCTAAFAPPPTAEEAREMVLRAGARAHCCVTVTRRTEMAHVLPADRRYPLEGMIAMFAADHRPDTVRGGCSCGFVAWSGEHVAVTAYREAVDRG